MKNEENITVITVNKPTKEESQKRIIELCEVLKETWIEKPKDT